MDNNTTQHNTNTIQTQPDDVNKQNTTTQPTTQPTTQQQLNKTQQHNHTTTQHVVSNKTQQLNKTQQHYASQDNNIHNKTVVNNTTLITCEPCTACMRTHLMNILKIFAHSTHSQQVTHVLK